MFVEQSYDYWKAPKIVNPEPWHKVAGRKQPQPKFPRRQPNAPSRKTKRQGRNG